MRLDSILYGALASAFVVSASPAPGSAAVTLLMAAGGGGGASPIQSGRDASAGASGDPGLGPNGGAGGAGGLGGAGGAFLNPFTGRGLNGGGGAGWLGPGGAGAGTLSGRGGASFPSFAGGSGEVLGVGQGGYGGGGGGASSSGGGSGGGGGYSGGGGGGLALDDAIHDFVGYGGGGGGSYISALFADPSVLTGSLGNGSPDPFHSKDVLVEISHGGTVTVFHASGRVVSYTVPETGAYSIAALGAQGASYPFLGFGDLGGFGAHAHGVIDLTAGQQLDILVGETGGNLGSAMGGGGGSFVWSVPEPSTWTMILAGFTGLGILMRRGRKRAAAAA